MAPTVPNCYPDGGCRRRTDRVQQGPNTLSKSALPRAKQKKPATAAKKSSAKPSRPKTGSAKKPAAKKSAVAAPEAADLRAAQETLRIVLKSLDDMKAEDSVTIDLAGKTSIGDYMVVSSGRSQRHVASIADEITRNLKKAGRHGVHSEGKQIADWVLIDAGDVIVHVFRPEVRAFYNIEKMWSQPERRAD
ncbi:MAG: ribosome silencing factor [Rhizobiales bacterium]|nr:ribosome silencing factor [Hyphomicrobiales bacterium]